MCCLEFNGYYQYLESKEDLYAKIQSIDAIILANIALIATLISGGNGTYTMYEMDDGQVRVKTGFRDINDVLKANKGLQTMKNLYINQINGRDVKLRDISTLRGWPWFGGC